MDAKLTLNVDKELAKKAKVYARDRGRSLSDLVEGYFKVLTSKSIPSGHELTEKVNSLFGSLKVPDSFDYKSDISKQISRKYLK